MGGIIRVSVSSIALIAATFGAATVAAAQDGSTAVAPATPPASSVAQEPAADSAATRNPAATSSSPTVEDIVVTAQFRRQNLQTTPIAITAVPSAVLEARGQDNVSQIAAQAPNVTLRPQGASFGSSLVGYIRGVGQADFNFALEPGVGVYVDDVYFATVSGSLLDLLDLDRVEILRGPQGTLAGKNSIGGSIKLYTKRPDGNGGGYLQATYGSYNRIEARGSADFTIAPDQLFARVSVATKHQQGYVDRLDYKCANPGAIVTGVPGLGTIPDNLPSQVHTNGCELGTEGGTSYTAGRIALRYHPSEALDVNLTADVIDDNSEVQASVLTAVNYPNPVPPYKGVPYGPWFVPAQKFVSYANFTDYDNGFGVYSEPPVNHMKQYGFSGNIDYTISDNLKLTSISGYRNYKAQFGDGADGSPVSSALQFHSLEHHQFTEEARLNGTIADKLIEYTVGGFYYDGFSRDSGRIDLSYSTQPATNCPLGTCNLDFVTGDPVPAKSTSGFAHVIVRPTQKLSIAGGLRYSHEKKSYTFVRLAPDLSGPAAVVGSLNGVTGKFSNSRVDYRLAVDYQWTRDLMTYAQFSTGYKGGGINPRPFVASQVVPFQPETIDAYEVGFKSELFDRRLRLNFSAFYNDYKNIQLTVFTCPQYSPPVPNFPCFAPLNGGDAHVKGAELELEGRPTDAIRVDASLSYLDFKYTRIDPAVGTPGGRGVQLGMVTPYTPKWKGSLGVQYEAELGALGTLTPRLDLAFQSHMYTNATNASTNRIQAYSTLNGRVTYRPTGDKWELALEVTNITNAYYPVTINDSFNTAYYVSIQPSRPREYALTLKRKF